MQGNVANRDFSLLCDPVKTLFLCIEFNAYWWILVDLYLLHWPLVTLFMYYDFFSGCISIVGYFWVSPGLDSGEHRHCLVDFQFLKLSTHVCFLTS